HLVQFDQLLGLRLRQGRVARRVLGNELDFATGNGAVTLFEEECGAFLLLLAAGGQRARFDREKANAQRLGGLRARLTRWQNTQSGAASEQCTAGNCS